MSQSVVDQVRQKYGAAATSGISGAHPGVRAIAEAFGYSAEDLAALPADANLGLSCGNPTATANLRAGEVVVDLGCGGGIDVLLAARKVGPTGKAIGIDMTPAMIDKARAAAAKPIGGQTLTNVEFHLAPIEQMPLADGTVDCLVSNCVINLAEDKSAVFREMYRVLKPGGRVAVSDIALKKALPAEIARDVEALIGCIAGALPIAEYEQKLTDAGFEAVQVVDSRKDLNAYALVEGQSACCTPAMSSSSGLEMVVEPCCSPAPASEVHSGLANLLRRYDINEYAASVYVYALKGR
jgi:ubiquinone/menaquinone biosynthesis C-methylase UbiE